MIFIKGPGVGEDGIDGTAGKRTEGKSREPGNTHREGTYLELGCPPVGIGICVWLCACICRQIIIEGLSLCRAHLRPRQTNKLKHKGVEGGD